MNAELKAMVKMAIDLFGAGKAALARQDFVTVIMPSLYKVASDIPGVASNFADLSKEFEALKTLPAEADLIAYVIANIAGVTTDEHAQKVISAAITLASHVLSDGIALEQAITAK